MRKTSAALAACATAFTLLLAGCGDDSATSSPSSTGTGTSAAGDAQVIDSVKVGTFLVSFRSAFPKLADGKDDQKISAILTDSCTDIKDGKPQADVVKNIVQRTKSGQAEASTEEAEAIYQMVKLMC